MERVIVRTGDATEILDAAGAVPREEVGDAAAVILAAFRTPSAPPDGAEWWHSAKAMSEELAAAVIRLEPRSVLVVIDDDRGTKERHLLRLAEHLVEEAGLVSSTAVGKDLTAIGTTVSDDADREVVAQRLRDFACGPIRLGNGLVIPARRLRKQEFRDVISEDLL